MSRSTHRLRRLLAGATVSCVIASTFAFGTTSASASDTLEEEELLPTAVAFGVPEVLSLTPEEDEAPARCSLSATKPVLTTASPPPSDDYIWRGNSVADCGSMTSISIELHTEIHSYTDPVSRGVGRGDHDEVWGTRLVRGSATMDAAKVPQGGGVRTITRAVFHYPYTLDRSYSPGSGNCFYSATNKITCRAGSSFVANPNPSIDPGH